MTSERTLVGWGTTDWPDLVAACAGMEAAWSDYEGFHVGALPTTQPPCSHLWAWSTDGSRLMRARPDGTRVVVGWLLQSPDQTLADKAALVDTVLVTTRPMRQWAPEDKRVTLRGTAPRTITWQEVDVETADPVTFVWAVHPDPRGGQTGQADG